VALQHFRQVFVLEHGVVGPESRPFGIRVFPGVCLPEPQVVQPPALVALAARHRDVLGCVNRVDADRGQETVDDVLADVHSQLVSQRQRRLAQRSVPGVLGPLFFSYGQFSHVSHNYMVNILITEACIRNLCGFLVFDLPIFVSFSLYFINYQSFKAKRTYWFIFTL